jgi:hypothetical protein
MGMESFGEQHKSADEEAARIAKNAEVRERLREKADALQAEEVGEEFRRRIEMG